MGKNTKRELNEYDELSLMEERGVVADQYNYRFKGLIFRKKWVRDTVHGYRLTPKGKKALRNYANNPHTAKLATRSNYVPVEKDRLPVDPRVTRTHKIWLSLFDPNPNTMGIVRDRSKTFYLKKTLNKAMLTILESFELIRPKDMGGIATVRNTKRKPKQLSDLFEATDKGIHVIDRYNKRGAYKLRDRTKKKNDLEKKEFFERIKQGLD